MACNAGAAKCGALADCVRGCIRHRPLLLYCDGRRGSKVRYRQTFNLHLKLVLRKSFHIKPIDITCNQLLGLQEGSHSCTVRCTKISADLHSVRI